MSSVSQDSFWSGQDKVPISQKSVSIPSQNGLEYSGGQRVIIEVPPTIEYIQPRESYLQFEVKLKLPAAVTTAGLNQTYLQLDETLGAQILLKDVRIYSGGSGRILLEEYVDYNVITGVKYSYETNDVIRAKRALTEGATFHSVKCRGTNGTTESHKNDVSDNKYFKNKFADTANLTDDAYKSVKVCLPLNTGLFSSNKVLPTLLTEGLVIDIQLEDANRVYRQLDTSRQLTKFKSKPVFHSVNGAIDGTANNIPNDADTLAIYVTNDNNILDGDQLPFCVGENIGFALLADGSEVVLTTPFVIAGIEKDGTNGLVKITFTGTGGRPTDAIVAGSVILHSLSVKGNADYDQCSYTISNVQMMVQQLQMPQGYTQKMMSMMKEGGSMNYDFLSFSNFKSSQLAGDVVSNIRLPLNMTRAKAILAVPTDASVYSGSQRISGNGTYLVYQEGATQDTADKQEFSDKSGLVGISDYISDYQFFYDGKLNPSRRVDCTKTSSQYSISQQPLIELEKALSMSNITPFSFRDFNNNFVIGRALSLHNGVYNTVGRDFNLQVNYEGTAPTKNKLWMSFISHIRRIEFKGSGISLQL